MEVFSKSSNAWVRATIETLGPRQLDSGGTAYKVRYISPKTQKPTEKTVARSALRSIAGAPKAATKRRSQKVNKTKTKAVAGGWEAVAAELCGESTVAL